MANNNRPIIYSRSILPPKSSDNEINNAVLAFLNKGGKVQILREDDGSYDAALKKTQQNLIGGFNPFSRCDALTINKDSLNKG